MNYQVKNLCKSAAEYHSFERPGPGLSRHADQHSQAGVISCGPGDRYRAGTVSSTPRPGGVSARRASPRAGTRTPAGKAPQAPRGSRSIPAARARHPRGTPASRPDGPIRPLHKPGRPDRRLLAPPGAHERTRDTGPASPGGSAGRAISSGADGAGFTGPPSTAAGGPRLPVLWRHRSRSPYTRTRRKYCKPACAAPWPMTGRRSAASCAPAPARHACRPTPAPPVSCVIVNC